MNKESHNLNLKTQPKGANTDVDFKVAITKMFSCLVMKTLESLSTETKAKRRTK